MIQGEIPCLMHACNTFPLQQDSAHANLYILSRPDFFYVYVMKYVIFFLCTVKWMNHVSCKGKPSFKSGMGLVTSRFSFQHDMSCLHSTDWQDEKDQLVSNWPTGRGDVAPYCSQVTGLQDINPASQRDPRKNKPQCLTFSRDSCTIRLPLQLISASIEVQTKAQ